MPSIPRFLSLADMRKQALLYASEAADPLVAQQYLDLARCYDAALGELHDTGLTIVPERDARDMPWRSVPLWSGNDQ